MLKVKLIKNLRKSIKQGHPWLYKDAVDTVGGPETQLCKVVDSKNKVMAWGYFDPHSDIAVRILSLESKPPHKEFYKEIIQQKLTDRFSYFDLNSTTAFRLINGEGDSLPGLICDVYNNVAVLQTDGLGASEFWDLNSVAETLLQQAQIECVFHKPRKREENSLGCWGKKELKDELVLVKENGLKFYVDVVLGQKTGFFLDQRDNRLYLRDWCKEKSVANLFSYTGGFSVSAGAGAAKSVTTVDISKKAISLSQKNWQENFNDDRQNAICADVFEFLSDENLSFDCLIVDPPSMAHSKDQKQKAVNKYIELFTQSAKRVSKGGDLFLSSCTSRINFDDFYEIMTASLSNARMRGQVLRYSGQGVDHPFLHICPEQRYLKFMHIKLLN